MIIIPSRLLNQHLVGEKCVQPEDVVAWLGAVQAQDFAAAKWSIGLRMIQATDAAVENAFNLGKFLRTHILRPTWHFVDPSDLIWMQELTAGNVKRLMGHYNRKLELDDALFKKSNKIIVTALKNNNYLTRQEFKKLLEGIGIQTNVQRLAHIVMWAELDALICSGPRKGRQFTYALVAERIDARKIKTLSRDESLAALAYRYFRSHGPAQLKDFSWWSGLSVKDATEALDLIKSNLRHETMNNKIYWFSNETSARFSEPSAFLLSIYDEYTIAYKDRSDINRDKKDIEKMILMGNALTSVIVIDGKIAGTWKRTLKKESVEVKINPFYRLSKEEITAVKKQVAAIGAFLGLTPILF